MVLGYLSDSPWDNSKGPDDHDRSSNISRSQMLLNALVPDAGQRASITTSQTPPSSFSKAFTSNEALEGALETLRNNSDPNIAAIPERWRRIFHPKGSAYTHRSDVNLNTVLFNRQAHAAFQPLSPSSSPPAPVDADMCGCWCEGKNFDAAKFGTDGSGLKKQISGCGALSDWKFNLTPEDPTYQWLASGRLPIGTKACVGRAVVSAGGTSPDGCTGAG